MKIGRTIHQHHAIFHMARSADLYNFKLAPSLTLGCGSWGGNSISENVESST
jgi:acetaldehyde dehydrogenase/alcohol dehydrogenase